MTVRRPLTMLAVALAAAAVVAVLGGASPGTGTPAPRLLLPNLQQDVPRNLQIRKDGDGDWRLGFRSAIYNTGRGPLMVLGHRPSTATPGMTADQVVRRSDGTTVRYRGVGRLQYVRNPTHEHWHLLGVETYQLRRAPGNRLVSPTQKTGFCLADSSHLDPIPGMPPQPVYRTECGLNQPDATEVSEGISVGWIDVYEVFKEGQSVKLSGAAAGRYFLVHRNNMDGAIHERSRTNDAATLLVRLSWPHGTGAAPTVEQLRACESATRCFLTAPALTVGQLRRYARIALRGVPRSVPLRCDGGGDRSGKCRFAFSRPSTRSRGSIRITSRLHDGVAWFEWSSRLTRRPRHCHGKCAATVKRHHGRRRAPDA